MKERPILFSALMVRAILDGRKTVTRRIVKPQPLWVADPSVPFKTADCDPRGIIRCPYGQPGDRLWVREAWQCVQEDRKGQRRCLSVPLPGTLVTAPNSPMAGRWIEYLATPSSEPPPRWRPSIHMPRWASRILLEVVSVRVERLNDISEADARAEGARSADPVTGRECILDPSLGSYRLHYRDIWEQINGPGSWEANPWVWVVEFKRI